MSRGFEVLLYYQYAFIADPETFARVHRDGCERLGLKGRIIVAHEGINGTVSGKRAATRAYQEFLHLSPSFFRMGFKSDPVDGHVFPRLSVKAREEIVSLHLGEEDIDPNEVTGERLSPREFYEVMQEEDVIILDGRNEYETQMGHFEGAVCPPLRNFREFPDWIRTHLADAKAKKVLTYCTGGIRCEKLSGFLKREGFENVFQLEGGIVSYAKDPVVRGKKFLGKCYVFDERIGVEANFSEDACLVSTCRVTGDLTDRYVNCACPSCNRQFFLSEAGQRRVGRYCSETCKRLSEKS